MNPGLARSIIRNISFFGDANIPKSDQTYKDAYNVAKALAEKGYTIINGGGPGVMNAATQGAEAVHGETISVTFSPTDAPGYEGKYLGNVTDEEIATTNYIERMFKLIEHGDMFIIFKGGSGTLSELGTAWVLAKLYYGHHKPFILYGRFWEEVIDTLRRNLNIDNEELSVFEICENETQVLNAILKFEKKLQSIDHSKHCAVCADKAFTL
jgi:uncharacterized protein (TIGR00730 family)